MPPRWLARGQDHGQVVHCALATGLGRGRAQVQAMPEASVVLVARVGVGQELLLRRGQPRQRGRQQRAIEHLVEVGGSGVIDELVSHPVKWDDYGIPIRATAGLQ
jgi:hypothetical protein